MSGLMNFLINRVKKLKNIKEHLNVGQKFTKLIEIITV